MPQNVSLYSNYGFLHTQGEMVFTGRTWLALSHAAVLEGLSHPELSARRVDLLFPDDLEVTDFLELRETLRAWTFFGDLVDVKAERKFIWDQLGPVALDGLSKSVEELTAELLEGAMAGSSRRIDVLRQLTEPLRRSIVRRFLHLPHISEDELYRACAEADTVFGFITGATSRVAPSAAAASMSHIKTILAQSGLLKITTIPTDRILSQLTLLLVVSVFIEKAIANVMTVLTMRPEQRSRGADLGSLIREALRLESPTQVTSRIARRDFEWRGCNIESGQQVSLVIGAANRDPAVFAKPGEFFPERLRGDQGPKTLTFGSGGKRCPGEWMTTTIVESAFRAIFEVASDSARIEELDWIANPESRRPTKLIVQL